MASPDRKKKLLGTFLPAKIRRKNWVKQEGQTTQTWQKKTLPNVLSGCMGVSLNGGFPPKSSIEK